MTCERRFPPKFCFCDERSARSTRARVSRSRRSASALILDEDCHWLASGRAERRVATYSYLQLEDQLGAAQRVYGAAFELPQLGHLDEFARSLALFLETYLA